MFGKKEEIQQAKINEDIMFITTNQFDEEGANPYPRYHNKKGRNLTPKKKKRKR